MGHFRFPSANDRGVGIADGQQCQEPAINAFIGSLCRRGPDCRKVSKLSWLSKVLFDMRQGFWANSMPKGVLQARDKEGDMAAWQLLVISTTSFLLLALPCQAGPCSKDIERTEASIRDKVEAIAAAGPDAGESTSAKMHRQPSPRSMAEAEIKLGTLSPAAVEKVKDAIARARKADTAGDKDACEQALADVQRVISQ